MSKLQLQNTEKIISKESASHITKMFLFKSANPGKMYITNMRIVFEPTQGRASSAFEHNLDEIESFEVGIAKTINILLKNNVSHKITGMFNKNLIAALEEVGIKKISK